MKKIVYLLVMLCLFVTLSYGQKKPKRTLGQLQSEATSARPDGKDFVFLIKGYAYAYGQSPKDKAAKA